MGGGGGRAGRWISYENIWLMSLSRAFCHSDGGGGGGGGTLVSTRNIRQNFNHEYVNYFFTSQIFQMFSFVLSRKDSFWKLFKVKHIQNKYFASLRPFTDYNHKSPKQSVALIWALCQLFLYSFMLKDPYFPNKTRLKPSVCMGEGGCSGGRVNWVRRWVTSNFPTIVTFLLPLLYSTTILWESRTWALGSLTWHRGARPDELCFYKYR